MRAGRLFPTMKIKSFACHFTAILAASLALTAESALGKEPTEYTFKLLTVDGFPHTIAYSVNNARWTLLSGGGLPEQNTYLCFPGGRQHRIEVPNSLVTVGLALNNRGDIVGDVWLKGATTYQGFLRKRSGKFETFIYPGIGGELTGMQVNAINEKGEIVGIYALSQTDSGSFIRRPDGTFESFKYRNESTHAYGINNRGQVSGQSHAGSFLRWPNGEFTPIAVAGAVDTQAFRINNRGQIVGLFYTGTSTNGFLRNSDGTYHTINVPGADATVIWDINDAGVIVGVAYFGQVQFGFIGTPKRSK
jgi:hypothetical protein